MVHGTAIDRCADRSGGYDAVLIPRAEELMASSEAAYLAVSLDFLNLINAQQDLLRFRLERERFWADQQPKQAERRRFLVARF